MKQGIVKFSKEFKTLAGNIWLGIENEYNMDTEDPIGVFKRAEETVHQFAMSRGLMVLFDSQGVTELSKPGPPPELPVINKAEERLGILIENSITKEELMRYKNDCSTVYLADLWATKLSTLNK